MWSFRIALVLSTAMAAPPFDTLPEPAQLWNASGIDENDFKMTCATQKDGYLQSECCGAEDENVAKIKAHSLVPLPSWGEDTSNCWNPVYIYCDVLSSSWTDTSYYYPGFFDSNPDWYSVFPSPPNLSRTGEVPPFDYTQNTKSGDSWIEFTTFQNAYAIFHAFGTHGQYYGQSPDPRRGWVSELYPNSYAAFNGWTAIKLNFAVGDNPYTMGGWGDYVPLISAMGICDEVFNFGDATTNPFKAYYFTRGKYTAGAHTINTHPQNMKDYPPWPPSPPPSPGSPPPSGDSGSGDSGSGDSGSGDSGSGDSGSGS